MSSVIIGGVRGIAVFDPGGVPAPLVFLQRDGFPIDLAAGSVDGSLAMPGGSAVREVVDTESKLSIADGRGNFSAGKTSPANGDPGIWWPSQARVAGKAMTALIRSGTPLAQFMVGWDNDQTTTLRHGFWSPGDVPTFSLRDNGATVYGIGPTLVAGLDFKLIVVLRDTGAFYFAWGNGAVYPRLLWVSSSGTDTPLYPSVAHYTNQLAFDDVNVAMASVLYSGFSTAFGMATARTAVPVTGDTLTAVANVLVEFTWTPASAETLSLYFRRTDDDNTWRLDCSQAGSTIKLYRRSAGVDTEVEAGKTQTFTAGTPYRIVIRADGTTIQTWVGTTIKHFATGQSHNSTVTGVKATGFTTGADFAAWSMGDAYEYKNLEQLFDFDEGGSFLSFGDSKTVAVPGYKPYLAQNLEEATGETWFERPASISQGSTTAAFWATNLSARLATAVGTPTHILCNLGVNDIAASVTEAAFKADYQTIIDLFHAKWPNAKIYLARPWRAAIYVSELAAMKTWIADLVTANPGVCYLGTDEIAFLEGGDDGATYMTDGIHPNAAGYALTATAWQTTMGF